MPGEAVDSWLDAYAARLKCTVGDLMIAAGIMPGPMKSPDGVTRSALRPDHTMALTQVEAARLAEISGLPVSHLHAMTLRVYDGVAVELDVEHRAVRHLRLWGRRVGSRYCPDCLIETGGRWLLRWRLSWVFACTRHQRLLAEACPSCGRPPRTTHGLFAACVPGSCDGSTTRRRQCTADLTRTSTTRLSDNHPLLATQAWIDTLLSTLETSAVLAETRQPGQPAAQVGCDPGAQRDVARTALVNEFQDLHQVATWLWSRGEPTDIGPLGDPWLDRAWRDALREPDRRKQAGRFAPTQAAAIGTLTTVAKAILHGDTTVATAVVGNVVRRERSVRSPVDPGSLRRAGDRVAQRLWPMIWRIRDPYIKDFDRLRYRTCTSAPRSPDDDIVQRARNLPQLLWPGWTMWLLPRSHHTRTFRSGASAVILLPGNANPGMSAAELLLKAGHPLHIAYTLARVGNPHRNSLMLTVCALADYLDHGMGQIDYARRRDVDAADLLPPAAWADVCERTATSPGIDVQLRHVRLYLHERITGSDLWLPRDETGPPDPHQRADFARTLRQLSVEVRQALDQYASRYLADLGIDEPLVWEPPIAVADHIQLPAMDLTETDSEDIRRFLEEDHRYRL
jgi:hypothetical protein